MAASLFAALLKKRMHCLSGASFFICTTHNLVPAVGDWVDIEIYAEFKRQ